MNHFSFDSDDAETGECDFEAQLARLSPQRPTPAFVAEVAEVFLAPVHWWQKVDYWSLAGSIAALFVGALVVREVATPPEAVIADGASANNQNIVDLSSTPRTSAAAMLPTGAGGAGPKLTMVSDAEEDFSESERTEGFVLVENQPYQQIRRRRIISTTWENRANSTVYRVSVPHEELILVPVRTY